MLSKLQDSNGKEMYKPALPSSNAEEPTHHRRDANRRIEVLEVSLGSLLEDGGRVTPMAEAGELNEHLRVLETRSNH